MPLSIHSTGVCFLPAVCQAHVLRDSSSHSAGTVFALTRSLTIASQVDTHLENANVCAKAATCQCSPPSNSGCVSAVLGCGRPWGDFPFLAWFVTWVLEMHPCVTRFSLSLLGKVPLDLPLTVSSSSPSSSTLSFY